jgi:CRISPR-associated protein Cst2
MYLHTLLVTSYGVAGNNCGEAEGNRKTLKKIMWHGEEHTEVSPDALRYAYRARLDELADAGNPLLRTNRYTLDGFVNKLRSEDAGSKGFNPREWADDDLLGFMEVKKTSEDKRRSAVSVSRAVSLDPWEGVAVFQSRSGEKGATSIYWQETHATAYSHIVTVNANPNRLVRPERAAGLVRVLLAPGEVGGNHARSAFDYSPETVVFQWTARPNARMMGAITRKGKADLCAARLVELVESGDIVASEAVVGGRLAKTPEGGRLKALGVAVYPGVDAAGAEICRRMQGERWARPASRLSCLLHRFAKRTQDATERATTSLHPQRSLACSSALSERRIVQSTRPLG